MNGFDNSLLTNKNSENLSKVHFVILFQETTRYVMRYLCSCQVSICHRDHQLAVLYKTQGSKVVIMLSYRYFYLHLTRGRHNTCRYI